jgi:Tfp pilus assembly protein PilN
MINLLPPEVRTGYIYAGRNVALRKWVVIFVVAIIGLGAIATYGLLAIKQSSREYEKQIAVAQANLKKDKYEDTQKRVKDMSSSFKLVVQVLGQEVLFSQLLKQIATAIPSNTKLTGLNISQVKGGIDVSAVATDYAAATQVQVNLADPNNKIFSKADIVSISCDPKLSASGASQYPCKVSVRALFAGDNPFLFINSKGIKP